MDSYNNNIQMSLQLDVVNVSSATAQTNACPASANYIAVEALLGHCIYKLSSNCFI